jgi:microsomal epoxide hydrolase
LLLVQPAISAGPEVKDGFFKTSDGVKLHYLEAGGGPPIVFEPGWSMPGWIWEQQIRHFAEHYHVIALDPRSQGDSEKTLEGNSCERRAQDIKELIEHLKLGPAVLVGWSLGVPELLSYAEQFGGSHVRAYVLVDGFAWEKQDPQFLTGMVGMYTQVQTNRRAFTEKFVRSMYKKPQPEEYIQRVMTASLKMPTDSAVAASVSSISRASWHFALAKLDRPVLVMCQARLKSMAADPVVALVPTARVELFEDAGHALFVDDAERLNSVLEDFIHHLPE